MWRAGPRAHGAGGVEPTDVECGRYLSSFLITSTHLLLSRALPHSSHRNSPYRRDESRRDVIR